MKQIELTKGRVTLVDDDDYERLSGYSWCCTSNGYAARNGRDEDGKMRTVLLHRVIMNAPDGTQVDHINHDRLDNRKENLRLCTAGQNRFNGNRHADNKTYKGVRLTKWGWQARINKQGKEHYLGLFNTAEEAAQAYDLKAVELFGEFARLNLPA